MTTTAKSVIDMGIVSPPETPRDQFRQQLWADTVKIQLQRGSNVENAFGQAGLVLKQFDAVFPETV